MQLPPYLNTTRRLTPRRPVAAKYLNIINLQKPDVRFQDLTPVF